MKYNPKVSIISPCYNGSRYISRMLESILKQEYENIELICVNDGSTDNTEEIIHSYENKFSRCGKSIKCVSQPNKGQAAALDNGLKHISGEYLAWIDCDDYILPSSISKKVDYLQGNKNCAVVTTDLYVINEEMLEKTKDIYDLVFLSKNAYTKGKEFKNLNFQKRQFYLTLVGLSIMECHTHLIDVSAFRRINPKMNIPKCRSGQNFQMLLPMYYHFNRGYIDEPLACYVVRKDSHYHTYRNDNQQIERLTDLINMLNEMFTNMGISEHEIQKYIKMSGFYKERERVLERCQK